MRSFAAGWAFAVVLATGPARAAEDTSRLQAFEVQLEANPSATAVLQAWCDVHGPKGTRIAAVQIQGASAPLPRAGGDVLHPQPGETMRYRRVRLMCGNRILSQAQNWYLPGKLTGEMKRTLDQSQTPFGRAVAALHFSRRNLETRYLPAGDDGGVLRHSAVLITEKGEPFSFVVETYTKAILGN